MDERIAALARGRYISLTTYRRDGRPVATPVWFAPDGSRILVWTDVASGKAKRIRATGRATIAPCDARGKITGAAMEASARMVPAADFAHANKVLSRRYALLKPLVELWTSVSHTVRRKPHPVEGCIELRLTAEPV